MKINEILKEIEKHDWWVEESPATHQTAEWAWHGFIESSKYFVKQYLSIGIFIYRNNFCSEVTPRDEKIKQFYFILQKYKIRTAYVQRKKKEWNRKANLMLKIGWRLLKDIKIPSNAEFSKIYSKFMNLYIDQARYSVFMECIDPFTEDELPIILKKELPEISEDKLGKISADMSALSTLSFMDKERIIFLESSLEALKNKNKIDKIAKELEKKYIWIATHYGKADPKTASKFKKDIIETLKKKSAPEIKKELLGIKNKVKRLNLQKRKIINKYGLSVKVKNIFKLVSALGSWVDERKIYSMQGTYIIYNILNELENRLDTPANLLAYTTSQELAKWILSPKNSIGRDILRERRKFSVYLVKLLSPGKSEAKFVFGNPARKIYDRIFKVAEVSEFKGTVASSPVKSIEGKVSVIFNTSKDKFEEGNILVTTMTRPDFLPFARKAKAIITDEGGLTCHAAIISRELGKPCIIGTKVATRTLKSGNRVKMDLETGIVKILK